MGKGTKLNLDHKNDRIGEINYNKLGEKMTIVGYRKATDIDVAFEDGHTIVGVSYSHFKNGCMKNLFYPSTFGKGYLGIGKYKILDGKKHSKVYQTWNNMIRRCYSENYLNKFPSYRGCSVCEEWLNFQKFGTWFDENYYEIEGEDTAHLDKDILVRGNKIYSPETCCFLPQRVNILLIKCDLSRGECLIGVTYRENRDVYISSSQGADGKSIYIGTFSTELEAFKAYKKVKEECIKEVANNYKNIIPNRAYLALMAYEVQITD